jgi:hypothetical protein
MVGAATSRAEAQIRRIATIYALMNQSGEVRVKYLRAALAVWSYCFDSARFIFEGRTPKSLEVRLERKVLRILRESSDGLTRTAISSAFDNHNSRELSSTLGRLRDQGMVGSRKEQTRGRAAERWFAVSQEDEDQQ